MLVNDLAQVLRNAGCSVEESAGWTTHNHGELTAVQTIVIHHTATPAANPGDYPSYNVVKNGRSDLPGPLAQLGVGRSGKIYVFSSGIAYHAGVVLSNSYNNAHAIGLEVESPGTGAVWPDTQVQATARAVAALCRKFGLPASRVLGHYEVCSPVGRKVDPVGIPGKMPAFRAMVQQYLSGGLVNAPAQPSKPNKEDSYMERVLPPTAELEVREVTIGVPWAGGSGGVTAVYAMINAGWSGMDLKFAYWQRQQGDGSQGVEAIEVFIDKQIPERGRTDGFKAPLGVHSLILGYTSESEGSVTIEAATV